jgi:CelD/BcsL family acetyltransferase involved in cellulose biosynthesis
LGEHLFDYRDVLATGDEQVLQHAWTRLSELRLPLHFAAVRGARTKGAWASLGMTEFCNAPQVLRAEVSVDEFAAIHRQSPRRLRQLASLGCSLRQRAGHHSQLVRWIYHRKAAQFAHVENSIFQDPLRIEFMAAAAALSGSACEIVTLEAAGSAVAALVLFRDGETRRFYTVYFDPAWARFSPGIALIYEVTRRSLSEGLDCDYMTGEQPHKMRFATSQVPLFRVQATADQVAQVLTEAPRSPLAA